MNRKYRYKEESRKMREKMQSILIVINNLECGGIQKALIEFINVISKEYKVTLRCFSHAGMLMNEVPPEVNVLPENKKLKILAESLNSLKKKSRTLYIKKIIWTIIARIIGGSLAHRIFFANINEKDKYDIAISYTQDVSGYSFSVGCNDYVNMCVQARKKITFVHCDFGEYGGNDRINRNRYKKFNNIICVSNSCKKVFDNCCPECAQKSVVIRNCVNTNIILTLSNYQSFIYDEKYTNYITVARVSKEKGIIRALSAFKILIEKGLMIRWYIVGNGPEMNEVREYIINNKLQENIITVGETSNPYRYMKNADCLLVPSYHECAPVVFDEAKVLKIPILTTKTLSAIELVEEENRGWVCENSLEGLIQGLDEVTIKLQRDNQELKESLNDYMDVLKNFDKIIRGKNNA